MSRILFVCHRIPYPPDKGDKLRSWAWLKGLSEYHDIDLVCFYDDPSDCEHLPVLQAHCDEVTCLPLSGLTRLRRYCTGLMTGQSLSEAVYLDETVKEDVQRYLGKSPDAVLLFSSGPFNLLPARLPCPLVTDLVDVDSCKWKSFAESAVNPIMRWIYAREAKLVAQIERRIAEASSDVLLVSNAEADLFRAEMIDKPQISEKVRALGNGVDLADFAHDVQIENPYSGSKAPVLLFTGAMDYPPNIHAVTRFANNIFGCVLHQFPHAQFWIVGARPTPEVKALAKRPNVHVTGRVGAIPPYFAHADVCVAPLTVARGVQNKVLEAMAMAKPIVVSREASTGIRADDGTHLLIADDDAYFADKVCQLLREEGLAREMGLQARQVIEQYYTWPDKVQQIMRYLQCKSV